MQNLHSQKNGLKLFFLGIFILPLALNFALLNLEIPFHKIENAENTKTAASNKNQIKNSKEIELAKLLEAQITTDTENYDNIYKEDLTHCKSLSYQALQILPKNHAKQLKKITYMFDPEARRGYGGQTTIKIRCIEVTDEEFVGVFLHEMGHIVDTGLIQGSLVYGKSEFLDGRKAIYNNDSSLKFYQISWKNNITLKTKNSLHFISGYSKTDPFEDFAESYNSYVSQGSRFRTLAKNNVALAKKYAVLKKYFFNNKEYGEEAQTRTYDTTILTYNLNLLLNSNNQL